MAGRTARSSARATATTVLERRRWANHSKWRTRTWVRFVQRAGEAVVDWRDVCLGLANVDDEAGECARGIELRRGPVEDTDCHDVEEVEDLACALIGIAQEAWEGRKQDGGLVLDTVELQAHERRTACGGGCLENEVHGVAVQNAKDWGGRGNVPEGLGLA